MDSPPSAAEIWIGTVKIPMPKRYGNATQVVNQQIDMNYIVSSLSCISAGWTRLALERAVQMV